jgi:5'-deoxynucleotidase YfbR-like HD superfamily hydrolase
MLSTLIELQRLKSVDRAGWPLRGLPAGTESVAAHSFGVAATVMLLADNLIARGVELDVERMLRMALMHDWAEARIGDMPRTATPYFGADARRKAESNALADIVADVENSETYAKLFDDYERRASVEARLVKAADIIDLLIQVLALERAGSTGLDEFWEVVETADFQLDGVAHQLIKETLTQLVKERSQIRLQRA